MKRLFILGCLCLAFHLQGQETSSTNTAALPRPVYRYLFLIDTSSAMSRQKAVTADTVSKLILSGIGGRMEIGNSWNLWTIDDQLHTNAFPAQTWDPRQRADVANRMFRFLGAQRFNKEKALLERAVAAVAEEAKLSGTLTVFLFTDGSAPVKGTPFDEPINEIFAKHAAGMRKTKKPFVTVFVAQDGRLAAHAVSPGGERIYIPRLPETVATFKKSEATARENAATAPPAPAKTLTAEEISELLRQSQKRQSNTVVTTPVPLLIQGGASQTNLVAAETSSKATVEALAQTPAASVPTSDPTPSPDQAAAVSKSPPVSAPASPVRTEPSALVAAETSSKAAVETLAQTPAASVPTSDPTPSPDQAAAVSKTPPVSAPASPVRTEPSALVAAETSSKAAVKTLAQTPAASVPASDTTPSRNQAAAVSKTPPASAPASPVRTEPSAPTQEDASAPDETIVPSTPQKDPLLVTTAETAVDDTGEALARSPASAQTAVLAQPEPLSSAAIYFMAAVALLLVALILVWFYVRSIRYVPRPSLISRSLEKEK